MDAHTTQLLSLSVNVCHNHNRTQLQNIKHSENIRLYESCVGSFQVFYYQYLIVVAHFDMPAP